MSAEEGAAEAASTDQVDKAPVNDRKANKKLVKQQQREKRQLKKQLKQAFNSQI